MLWVLLAVLLLYAGVSMMRRRRAYETADAEPWRASLAADDEPLDMEEIRRAEDQWLADEEWSDHPDEDSWRGA